MCTAEGCAQAEQVHTFHFLARDSMGEACVNLLANTVWVSRSQILACIRTSLL
jgi:hypothetical protein